jgi:hypothetical protein
MAKLGEVAIEMFAAQPPMVHTTDIALGIGDERMNPRKASAASINPASL